MTIETGKDGKSTLMIQCISCKWWDPQDTSKEWRACTNPGLRAHSWYKAHVIVTSPIFACNQSEAK